MTTLAMVAGLLLAALYLDPWAMAVLLAAIGGVVTLLLPAFRRSSPAGRGRAAFVEWIGGADGSTGLRKDAR